jgi:hypothetical protein
METGDSVKDDNEDEEDKDDSGDNYEEIKMTKTKWVVRWRLSRGWECNNQIK